MPPLVGGPYLLRRLSRRSGSKHVSAWHQRQAGSDIELDWRNVDRSPSNDAMRTRRPEEKTALNTRRPHPVSSGIADSPVKQSLLPSLQTHLHLSRHVWKPFRIRRQAYIYKMMKIPMMMIPSSSSSLGSSGEQLLHLVDTLESHFWTFNATGRRTTTTSDVPSIRRPSANGSRVRLLAPRHRPTPASIADHGVLLHGTLNSTATAAGADASCGSVYRR